MNFNKIYCKCATAPKISSIISNTCLKRYYNGISVNNVTRRKTIVPLPNTHITTLSASTIEKTYLDESKPSLITRILKKVPYLNLLSIDKHKLNAVGFFLYESVADRLNYAQFFEEFSLPDTFYSWFVVTELHLWMLIVRCMAEGNDGRFVRNIMVQALWTDVGLRVKKLGTVNLPETKVQIKELSEQFQAALIAYDEGLQSNDIVMAGAIWRRMYQHKEVDPENLEALIKYIRKQVTIFDNTPREGILSIKPIAWEPIFTKK